MAAFVIEMTNRTRKNGKKLYVGSVDRGVASYGAHRIARRLFGQSITHVRDSEVRSFHTLEEAKPHGFPSVEEAEMVIRMLRPTTRNTDYKVVRIKDGRLL